MSTVVSAANARFLANRLKALDINKLEHGAVCNICQQPFFSPDLFEFPFATPCGHVFGNHCLMKWLAGGKEIKDCPCCRRSILKHMTDEEGSQRAMLEELDMHGPREPIPDDQSTWNGRIKYMLSDSGRDWAVEAEELWRIFLAELLESLDAITTAEEWISGHGVIVRKFLKLATVERFYEVMDTGLAHGFISARPVFGISDTKAMLPQSYQALCERLDRPFEDATVLGLDDQRLVKPLFLEATEDWYAFLADCHHRLEKRYMKLNGDLTIAFKQAWS
jgi:hypothetical protein